MRPAAPPDPDSLVEAVVHALGGDDPRRWRWSIRDECMGGEPSILGRVAAALRRDGRRVLHLAPPLAARDSGIVAASQLAVELGAHGGVPELSQHLHDPSLTWEAKIALLRDALEDVREDVVVLAEFPDAWPSSRREGREYATSIAVLVESLAVRLVVTSSRTREPARGWVVGGHLRTHRLDQPHSLLWSRLSERLVSERPALDDLSSPSMRALTAFADLTSPEDALEVVSRARSHGCSLPRALYLALGARHDDLRRTWRFLALVRTPFDEGLLDHLGAPPAYVPEGRLLRDGLLQRQERHFRMDVSLRHVARPEPSEIRTDLHGARLRLSDYYARDPERRPASHIEAFHHAAAALDVEAVSRVQRQFAEQAWIFADRLFEARRPHDARTYLEALADTPRWAAGSERGAARGGGDQPAEFHHRLAFAADADCDAPTAESHYRRALEHDSRNPLLHSRFICFLLDRGLVRDARLAWEHAHASLPQPEDLGVDDLVALHAQVAWRLVRVGDVEFAEGVLSEVPPFSIDSIPSLRTVHQRMRALRLVRQHGPVRPFGLLEDGWWHHLPPELPSSLGGEVLRHWWAGRVELADEEGVMIEIAAVEAGSDDPPVPGRAEYTVEELTHAGLTNVEALRRGVFLVAGFYGPDAKPSLHRVSVPDTRSGIPRPELDPQRYLKARRLAA